MTFDSHMNREIIHLAYPVIVGMISHTVLNLVDTAMVGRLGDVALGAVGLGSFFVMVTVLIFGSLGVGTQAITARRLGENRTEEFVRIAFNAFLLSCIVGIVVSLAGYGSSTWIFHRLSDRPEIVEKGIPYLRIRFLGIFSLIIIFTLRGYAFGMARVRIDMIVSLIVNLLNIVLNYFLIFGHWIFPRLEVSGAALASVISTVVGLVIYLLSIRYRIIERLPHDDHGYRLSRELVGRIARISAPRAIQSFSILGFIVFLSLIGKIGVGELAISNIIFKAFNFSFMIGLAIGAASATLVGRSLGQGNGELAARYGWHSVGLGTLGMGCIGILFMLFPRQIMGVFTHVPDTIEKGVLPFRLLGAFQFIDGAGIVLSRTLQGAGSTLYVMISEMVAVWCVLIPFSYITVMVMHGGIVLAWWALFLYIIVFSAAMLWKFHEGGWKKIKI
ncbi:MAG: MATE family efflux transporter [bacterium]|nr:MAG: MATE family efflux transporter [bacterium]